MAQQSQISAFVFLLLQGKLTIIKINSNVSFVFPLSMFAFNENSHVFYDLDVNLCVENCTIMANDLLLMT